jgi:hypothetical protein
MNISKDQIVQLLESQGNHDKAQQASQQLSDQVDTDTGGRWWRWPSGNLQPSGAVRADCPLAPHPLDPANPAAVLGSAGLDRRDIVVRPLAEARRTLHSSSLAQLEQYWFATNDVEVMEPA